MAFSSRDGFALPRPLKGDVLSAARIPDVNFGSREAMAAVPTFEEIYDAHAEALWRCARAMGVAEQSVPDILQEVFVVVHRRMSELEHSDGIRTWLTRILIRVIQQDRRAYRRKREHLDELGDDIVDAKSNADELVAQKQATEMLMQILDAMHEERRAVFVLMEIEQLTAPETADALGVNLNTVYSRLRLARRDYNETLERLRTHAEGTPS